MSFINRTVTVGLLFALMLAALRVDWGLPLWRVVLAGLACSCIGWVIHGNQPATVVYVDRAGNPLPWRMDGSTTTDETKDKQ